MKKRMSVLLSLLLAGAMLAGGCSSQSPVASSATPEGSEDASSTTSATPAVSGKLLFWHTYSDTEEKILLEQVIPAFEKQYADVTLEAVRMPMEGLKQQLITAVSGGAAPDVMRMDIVWTPEFAKMGALEKLDDKEGFAQLKESVFEGPLATCAYNGAYYGLPLNTNTKIAIWNKALLEQAGLTEPPKTFEEFEAAALQISDKGVWGYGLGSPEMWNFIPLFLSMGGQFTDPAMSKGSGFINSAESVQVVEKMVEWYDKGLIGPTVFGEEPGNWGGIAEAKYLMIDDGPWYFSLTEDADKVFPSLFPTGKGGSISVVGGENIINFTSSKNKDAAWAFTRHMMEDATQLMLVDAGVIPTKTALASDPKIKDDAVLQLYFKQLETAAPRTVHPSFNKINEEVRLCIEKALRHDGDVQALMDALALSIDEALAS